MLTPLLSPKPDQSWCFQAAGKFPRIPVKCPSSLHKGLGPLGWWKGPVSSNLSPALLLWWLCWLCAEQEIVIPGLIWCRHRYPVFFLVFWFFSPSSRLHLTWREGRILIWMQFWELRTQTTHRLQGCSSSSLCASGWFLQRPRQRQSLGGSSSCSAKGHLNEMKFWPYRYCEQRPNPTKSHQIFLALMEANIWNLSSKLLPPPHSLQP